MRIRSSLLVGALTTSMICGFVAPPATAAGTTTIVSRTNLPAAFTDYLSGSVCGPTGGHGEYLHVTGPASPPIGVGSLELTTTALYQTNLYDDAVGGALAADLSRFTVHSVHAAADPVELHALVVTSDGIFGANIPATGTWTSFDALSAPGAGGTWTQFLTDHPSATITYLGVALEGCESDQASTANVDDLEIGVNGQTTRYDFEPAIAPAATLSAHLDHTAIVAGRPVTPSVTVRSGGSPVAGVPVNFLARPAGSTSYHQLTSAMTNSAGLVVAPIQHPVVTTTYEWQVPAGADVAAVSKTSKVSVASRVSINAPAKVKKGKKFTATGVMTPKHKGDLITLFATRKGHTKQLATSKVHADGSYAVTAKLRKKGRYRVFTTAAADATNSKGTSVKKPLRVH